MRTTLTIDDDIARRLETTARAKHCSFRDVVNSTLRCGLELGERRKAKPFNIVTRNLRQRPGVQVDNIAELLESLDETT